MILTVIKYGGGAAGLEPASMIIHYSAHRISELHTSIGFGLQRYLQFESHAHRGRIMSNPFIQYPISQRAALRKR